MTIMYSCCFFSTLRRASYVSVIYTTIYFSISCVTVSTFLYEERVHLEGELDKPMIRDTMFEKDNISPMIFNVFLLVCACSGVVSSLLVIIGLQKDARELLLPWMIVMVADAFLEFGHFLYLMFFERLTFVPITAILFTIEFFITCLNIYCLLCVLSQYQEYRAGRGCAVPEESYTCTVEARHYNSQAVNNTQHQPPTSCLNNIIKTNTQKLIPICSKQKQTPQYIVDDEKSIRGGKLKQEEKTNKKRVQFPD